VDDVWNNPAVDAVNNVPTFTTANPTRVGSRPGTTCSSSMVALDPISGDYKWHFQIVHHDRGLRLPVADRHVHHDNRRAAVPAVGESCKTGWIYELDRTTGNPITQIDEKEVPQNGFNNSAMTPTGGRSDHGSGRPISRTSRRPR
jgi:glucose dehydrogenase